MQLKVDTSFFVLIRNTQSCYIYTFLIFVPNRDHFFSTLHINLQPVYHFVYGLYIYFSIMLLPRSRATTPVRHISMIPKGFITSLNALILDGSPVTSIHM